MPMTRPSLPGATKPISVSWVGPAVCVRMNCPVGWNLTSTTQNVITPSELVPNRNVVDRSGAKLLIDCTPSDTTKLNTPGPPKKFGGRGSNNVINTSTKLSVV